MKKLESQSERPRDYSIWREINDDLIEFSNKAKQKHFEYLFESDAERLFLHFVLDCNRMMQKFYTYLTYDQYSVLLINCHENKTELYTL